MEDLISLISDAIASLYNREVAVFALSSAFIALLIWALDFITAKVSGKSLLIGVGYGGIRTISSFCIWGLGAGIAAYIGGIADLFVLDSLSAKMTVGIGWPTVLPRIIAMTVKEDEPEQGVASDDEEEEQ